MKKAKYFVALGFIVLGIILCVVGGIMYYTTDYKDYYEVTDFSQVYSFSDTVSDVIVDCPVGTVKIVEGNELFVEAEKVIADSFNCDFSDGVLSVKYENRKLSKFINVGFMTPDLSKSKITITIPSGSESIDSLKITNGVGEMTVSGISAKNASFENGVGEFRISGCTFYQKFKLNSGVGSFRAEDCTIANPTIDNRIGESRFINCSVSGDLDISNGIGEIDLEINGDMSDYSFDVDNGIGEVKINGSSYGSVHSKGPYTVEIDNGIGSISIDFK